MVDANIFGIIISEFHHEKKPYLIILLKVDKSLEISFHCAILPFGLIIYLCVEGSRESMLDAKEMA